MELCIYGPPDMSGFININGKTLKYLDLVANPHDSKLLGKLFQSIVQWYKNLVDLSIIYTDEVDQELMEIFNNCIKLESIEIKNLYSIKTDGDRILALNQTLPKKLKSIIINIKIFY